MSRMGSLLVMRPHDGETTMLEKIATLFLGIAAVAWLVAMIAGFIAAWPVGIFGLLALAGIGLLTIKAIKDRLTNQEDDHYAKNVNL